MFNNIIKLYMLSHHGKSKIVTTISYSLSTIWHYSFIFHIKFDHWVVHALLLL